MNSIKYWDDYWTTIKYIASVVKTKDAIEDPKRCVLNLIKYYPAHILKEGLELAMAEKHLAIFNKLIVLA